MEQYLDEAREVKEKLENAISAHNSGSLQPRDLHEALDAANAHVASLEAAVAEPQGSPVPDTGDGLSSTAGFVPAPSVDDDEEDSEDE